MGATDTAEGDKYVLAVNDLTGRTLVLNRPKALNSLTLPMVQSIKRRLQEWEESELCNVVMIRSNSAKAFCAGGDVVQVSRDWKQGNRGAAMRFFQAEYQVNHYIAAYKKPIVAFIGGYTMGGGVGLSMHAAFRVATESTVFAMPETKIGFFPDVGATFFLPRLDGQTGVYLGLTGRLLKGRDLLYAGIATHYVPTERLPLLEQRLQGVGTSDYEIVNAAIEEFVAQPEDAPIEYSLAGVRECIDRCFQFSTMEEIVEALRAEAKSAVGEHAHWAQETLATLEQLSPSSLKLTLDQLRRGQQRRIQGAFELELRLAERRLGSHDMHEGIEALLVRKSNDPKWDPPSLDQVDAVRLNDYYFNIPTNYTPWFVDPSANFDEYPHKFGLPTERDVRALVTGANPQAGDFGMSAAGVLQFFDRECASKIGVHQKIAWILARKTRALPDSDVLQWVD
ncbi:3-hydroxyisobutyryl-CoA hydrolase [Coemansia nantahalensis]|uniref:3-hydroxyisobutyryl-CoA hydrolase n=1 Tax=Coemansia nantahalensis TaxID=2789366 RepID=A0ACC1JYC6_9FUNG|nr:3-hydroxyisobutyryl-CoA hydrolase [Coemansia nantahalensis]KAJ2775173.1 3-hydroxyisobutyryl-CoA hydrolase [Coemansia nantahalensis]